MIKKCLIKEGDILITDFQVKGRGQRGNIWESEAGKNLTLSVYLKPVWLDIDRVFFLNIMTSLAIIRSVEKFTDGLVKIKWPNDIYLLDKKLGGILIENSIFSSRIESTVLGIGININQERFPGGFPATSLKLYSGEDHDLNEIFNFLISSLDREYQRLMRGEYSAMKDEYLKRLYRINEKHIFSSGKDDFEGVVRGIEPSGNLLVEIDGSIKSFDFKEISFVH